MTIRIGLILVLSALFANPASAQQLWLGARAGVATANVGGEDVSETELDSRVGLDAGAFVRISFNEMFAVRPEIAYVQKGAGEPGEDALYFSYLQIPILAELSIPIAGAAGFRPFVMAGPAVAWRVACTSNGFIDEEVPCDDPALGGELSQLNDMDTSLIFGGGMGLAMGPGEAIAEFRYDLGLSSLDESPEQNNVENRAWTVMLGYAIPLGI